jgi:membrane associated rhomboid family serine protease
MFEKITPFAGALIVANVLVFALFKLLGGSVAVWLALWPVESITGADLLRPWQVLTYSFLHVDGFSLFLNMFALFMFGPALEHEFGRSRFATYYVFCVIGAALMHLIVTSVSGLPPAAMYGASGGVFGLLLAYGMLWPQRELMLLFPPIPMPAWLFVTLFALFELVMGVRQTSGGAVYLVNFGGMATGFVLLRYWRARQQQRRRR